MNTAAILALLSDLYEQLVALRQENEQLQRVLAAAQSAESDSQATGDAAA